MKEKGLSTASRKVRQSFLLGNCEMRWKTYSKGLREEVVKRKLVLNKIEKWWEAFQAKREDLELAFDTNRKWDIASWMNKHIGPINHELMWEFGPGEQHGHRLVITPESNRHLRPLVDVILEMAPSIPGWSFYGFRRPEELEQAEIMVKTFTEHKLFARGARLKRGRFNRVDLTFEFPEKYLVDEDLCTRQAFIALEYLLGEELLNNWLGYLDVSPNVSDSVPLHEIKGRFELIVKEIQSGLPPAPYLNLPEPASGKMYELAPEASSDYPARQDMWVASTIVPEALENAIAGVPFCSCRYSRFGELFCYIKIDGTTMDGDGSATARSEVGDLIDRTLRENNLGCCIGGGTGLRYSYIDMVVLDFHNTAMAISKTLQAMKITKKCWILFFDNDWHREWVGIWKDTPAPPGEYGNKK